MPIRLNAAKTETDFVVLDAAKTQADAVRVNAAKDISYLKSDPVEQTFLPTDHLSYKISGGNYTGPQLSDRQRIAYYGRNSTRREGNMQLFDQSAIAAFLAVRPNVEWIKVRQTSQHTVSGTNTVDIQWHNQDPLPVDQQAGWVTPFGELIQMNLPKSTPGVRVEVQYSQADSQAIADGFVANTRKGISMWVVANTLDRWGWAAGWQERSSGESAGSPTGFTNTDSSNRIEMIIRADF